MVIDRMQLRSLTRLSWDRELIEILEEVGWSRLKKLWGISKSNYSTSKIFEYNSNQYSNQECEKKKIYFSNKPIFLEALSNYTINQLGSIGLEVINTLDDIEWAQSCLEKALDLFIEKIPMLSLSVQSFVRSIHLLEVEDDSYDVSYSDPEIPFSIFVSVSNRREKKSVWRVAESIIHESMHLQLTLLEYSVPLIRSERSGEEYYSPWKGMKREARGILHALYVFDNIKQFWWDIIKLKVDNDVVEFANGRIMEIESEMSGMYEFVKSPDLTKEGYELVSSIFDTRIE